MFTDYRTLAKGERLPKYKYKEFDSMCGRFMYYNIYTSDEKLIGEVAVPRHKGMLRKYREWVK